MPASAQDNQAPPANTAKIIVKTPPISLFTLDTPLPLSKGSTNQGRETGEILLFIELFFWRRLFAGLQLDKWGAASSGLVSTGSALLKVIVDFLGISRG